MNAQHMPGNRWSGLVLAALLSGCGGGTDSSVVIVDPPPAQDEPTPASALGLQKVASCADYTAYLADSITHRLLGQQNFIAVPLDLATAAPPPAPVQAPALPGFIDVTGTNNQEAGVDEIDLIEADPRGLFYLINGGTLVVVTGEPASEMAELAHLELSANGGVSGITYDEPRQRLVALVSEYTAFPALPEVPDDAVSILPYEIYAPHTDVLFIDVADPAAPVIDERVRFEGALTAARRIDGRVHVVGRYEPQIPVELLTDPDLQSLLREYADAQAVGEDTATLEQRVRNAAAAAVAAYSPDEFLPSATQSTDGGDPVPSDLFGCEDVARPDAVVLPGMLLVASFDTDGSNASSLLVTNESWQVYASESHLYVSETSGNWFFNDRQSQQTAIYKIAVGDGEPQYEGVGVVGGWLADSFQLSEHEGYLRVVTHHSQFDPSTGVNTMDNSLFVLEDDGAGSLETVGSVASFGKNENIFSARFAGDRGYVVTFRQIDPLFTFDLSNPTNPRLMGEVEIPGVSTYMHPIDEDHLLTIGRAGTDAGLTNQLQLQIFSVADLSNPVRLHSFEPAIGNGGHSWSAAEYDHLAFTYFEPAQVLAIPLRYWSSDSFDAFSGFLVVRPDTASGFEELGRVDHDGLAYEAHCAGADAVDDPCLFGYYQDAAEPLRSAFAVTQDGTFLYTLSNAAIVAHDLDDLTTAVATVTLPYQLFYWWF